MLENKVYVFDDLVSKSYQEYLKEIFYNHVDYNFTERTAGYLLDNDGWKSFISFDKIKDKIYDGPQMVSPLAQNNKAYNSHFYKIIPLFNFIQEHFKYTFNYNVFRSKANLKHKVGPEFLDKVNPPHIDDLNCENLWILIYYIDDSDGDTIIYNESYNPFAITDTFTIDQTISPKQGRLIFFPGYRFHSASSPIQSSTRLILNNVLEIFPI